MLERFAHGETFPPIKPGEVLLRTPNFWVVTDYKPGLEGQRAGERFFIEPSTSEGTRILISAAKAHNIFEFNLRPHPYSPADPIYSVPCLRADYIPKNIPVLFQGVVEIPKPGEDSIPSPDRMDECIEKQNKKYTFIDGQDYEIPNPATRHLRLLQAIASDEIPDRVIHSADPNPYYKVRKGWWNGMLASLELGLDTAEFTDTSLVQKIQAFMKRYLSREFSSSRHLTTQEDIAHANRLIDEIWEHYGKVRL